MPGENRQPDVDGIELPRLPNEETDPERHEDLRDHRDIQRALRIPSALQPTRIRERDRNEQSGEAQHAQQLNADVHDNRIMHPEHGEQLTWQEQEEGPTKIATDNP